MEQNEEQAAFILPLIGEAKHLTFVGEDLLLDIPSLDNIHYIRAMDQIREDFDLRVNLPDPHWTPGQGAPIKRGRKGKR